MNKKKYRSIASLADGLESHIRQAASDYSYPDQYSLYTELSERLSALAEDAVRLEYLAQEPGGDTDDEQTDD